MSSILWGLGPSKQKLPSAHLNALDKERKKQEAAAKRREERVALVKRRKDREGINPPPTTRSAPANLSQVRTTKERAETTDIEYLVKMVLFQLCIHALTKVSETECSFCKDRANER